jgi:hypothetical protein
LLDGAGADKFLQEVEANGFGYVELKEHENRPAKIGFGIGAVRHDGLILP